METNKFEINVDEMQVLNGEDRATLSNHNRPGASEPLSRERSPEDARHERVQNHEEDGAGFFITGINTKEKETIDDDNAGVELEAAYEPDPVDSYKHIAVVDCSKAFSS